MLSLSLFFQQFYCPILPLGFILWESQVVFPGESQLRQSSDTQPTVHVWCFSVSVIHRTLTWTTGSLTCTQMSMHMIAHRGVWTPEESQCWKLTLGEKLFAAPGNQTCISGMMVQCGTNWAMSPPQFWHGRTEKQPLPLLCPRVEPLPLGWQSSGLANQPLIPIQL